MFSALYIFSFFASVLALPSPQLSVRANWSPAPDSSATCTTTDKVVSFYIGPQKGTVLNDACAAIMPACAYPDRLPPDTICTQTIDFTSNGPKNSTQSANIEDAETDNKIGGYALKLSVTPPAGSNSTWSKYDCYGYFDYLMDTRCRASKGSGIGNLTVGDSSSLRNTVFGAEIVKRE